MNNLFYLAAPLSLGDIWDRAFRLYRAHFATMTLTVVALSTPLFLLDTVVALLTVGDVETLRRVGYAQIFLSQAILLTADNSPILISLLRNVVDSVVVLALTHQSIRVVQGSSSSVVQSIRVGLRRFWAYLGAILLMLLMVSPIGIGLFILILIFDSWALILLIIPALFFGTRWAVVTQALLADEMGPGAAINRSWQLTKGLFWRSMLFILLLYTLVGVIAFIFTGSILALLALIFPPDAVHAAVVLQNLVAIVGTIFVAPISAAAHTVFYYDLRVRQESYDLEQRIVQMEDVQMEDVQMEDVQMEESPS